MVSIDREPIALHFCLFIGDRRVEIGFLIGPDAKTFGIATMSSSRAFHLLRPEGCLPPFCGVPK